MSPILHGACWKTVVIRNSKFVGHSVICFPYKSGNLTDMGFAIWVLGEAGSLFLLDF